MPINAQKMREIVMQLLFSSDFGENCEQGISSMLMQQLTVSKKTLREAHAFKKEIEDNQERIDSEIKSHCNEYELQRIARVERTILRLGAYELLFSKKTPPKVAIAEAIRLSRKFATPEAAGFVNAILDALYKAQSTLVT